MRIGSMTRSFMVPCEAEHRSTDRIWSKTKVVYLEQSLSGKAVFLYRRVDRR